MPRDRATCLLAAFGALLTIGAVSVTWIESLGNESVYILRGYGASSYSGFFNVSVGLGADAQGVDVLFAALAALTLVAAAVPKARPVGLVIAAAATAGLAPLAVETVIAEYESYDIIDIVLAANRGALIVAAAVLSRHRLLPWIALVLSSLLASQAFAYGLGEMLASGRTERVGYLHALVVAPLAIGAIGLLALRSAPASVEQSSA